MHSETRTRPDGVVGHFGTAFGTKSGLLLNESGSQFVVVESKVYSALRTGTKNAAGYDQAVRTIACMAQALAISGHRPNLWSSLAFYVFAPASRINAGVFDREISKESMLDKIDLRISRYPQPRQVELREWQRTWALPVIEQIKLACWSWESIIESIERHDRSLGGDVRQFYELTLRYNGPQKMSSLATSAAALGFDVVPVADRPGRNLLSANWEEASETTESVSGRPKE